MSGLVTGEAVALGVQTAKLPTRALAVMVDLVVFWSVYLAVLVGLAGAPVGGDAAAGGAGGGAAAAPAPGPAPRAGGPPSAGPRERG
ncbi:hypothetical protein ACFW9F_28735, partial [Streptomyces sp. NPDC059506]